MKALGTGVEVLVVVPLDGGKLEESRLPDSL